MSKLGTKLRRWSDEEILRCCALRRGGATTAETAAILGRSQSSVLAVWCRHGEPKRHQCYRDRREKLQALHGEGCSSAEIARRLKVHQNTVGDWLRKLNLVPNGHNSPGTRELHRRTLAARLPEGWCFNDVRDQVWQKRCQAMGWSEVDSPADARVLALLLVKPLTCTELALALKRNRLNIFGRLRRLSALGLVEGGGFHGPVQNVYRLAAWLAARKREERAC